MRKQVKRQGKKWENEGRSWGLNCQVGKWPTVSTISGLSSSIIFYKRKLQLENSDGTDGEVIKEKRPWSLSSSPKKNLRS